MARGRSRVKGVSELARSMRAAPEIFQEELGDTMQGITARLLSNAQAETPVRSRLLRGLIKARFLPKTLKIKLGLLTKAAQRKGFYGYILDQGRRGRTVTAKRRRADGTITQYAMRIRAISRNQYDFIFGRPKDFVDNELGRMRDAVQRALRRVARGAGNHD